MSQHVDPTPERVVELTKTFPLQSRRGGANWQSAPRETCQIKCPSSPRRAKSLRTRLSGRLLVRGGQKPVPSPPPPNICQRMSSSRRCLLWAGVKISHFVWQIMINWSLEWAVWVYDSIEARFLCDNSLESVTFIVMSWQIGLEGKLLSAMVATSVVYDDF